MLYAYDASSAQHERARAWLERVFNDTETVRLALISLLAFLRISTNRAVFQRPLAPADAIGIVASWLEVPGVAVAEPTDRHWALVGELASRGQARGPLLMDAHVAALAIEHGATLYTTDRDFTRFPGLRARDPLNE